MIVFLLLLLGAVMNDTSARDVISFNTGWQFKKGPFSTDPMRASAQWDGKWEEVTIPHTWNAKDMQVKADAFYEGVGYVITERNSFSEMSWRVNVYSCVLKE